MRTRILKSRMNAGNTLLITVLTCLLIGVVLASYLVMVSNQNLSVMRSLAWNSAIPIAEAGLEEGLMHVNQVGVNGLASNGWIYQSTEVGGAYVKSRHLDDGVYEVWIVPTDPPTLYSSAKVRAPLAPASVLGIILASATPGLDDGYLVVERRIKVTTKTESSFWRGMIAKDKMTFSGQASSDSFNSSDPNWSTNGRYDPAKTRDKGDVASNGTIEKVIDTSGQVKIKGRVATGPGGTIGMSGQVSIGSSDWVDDGNNGIQPGWQSNDMNKQFPDVQVPFTSGYSIPGAATVGGTNYTLRLGSGNYRSSQVSLSGQKKVLIDGNAIWHVQQDFSMSGQTYIYIAEGASLKLYVQGSSANLSGQGVINGTGNAVNFQYHGLPSNKDINLSGNSAFIGTIYAPSAKFKMSGGGNDPVDFIGASITGEVTMSGHYKFHYDEALGGSDSGGTYIPDSWNEF